MANINEFVGAIKKGGARSTRFRVKVTNPANPIADISIPFLTHAASLPRKSVRPIPLSYFGRTINVHGSQEFDAWNVRVYNDEDFNVRDALEHWMNFMNGSQSNITTFQASDITLYKSLAEVDQMSITDEVLRSYKFVGIFPIQLGEIGLDWDNEGVESFDATFAVDYYYASFSSTGRTGGEAINI